MDNDERDPENGAEPGAEPDTEPGAEPDTEPGAEPDTEPGAEPDAPSSDEREAQARDGSAAGGEEHLEPAGQESALEQDEQDEEGEEGEQPTAAGQTTAEGVESDGPTSDDAKSGRKKSAPAMPLPAKSLRTRTPGPSRRLQRTARGLFAAVSALFVLAITAGVLTAGLLREAPAAEPVAANAVEVGAGPLALVCSDTPRLITDDDGADIDYDAEFGPSPEGVQARTDVLVLGREAQPPGEVDYQVLDQQSQELDQQGQLAYNSYPGAEAPGVLLAAPSQERTALGAGSAVSRADEGDLRGLSAAPCQVPSATAWLVGGSTELGSSARLTLTNPGQTPVSAEVQVWGDTGPVEGSASVLVPPGSAQVVLLETLSLEERLAVRVTSDGGRLAAVIQDSGLQGVVPGGTDMVTASADPATEITLGPVVLPETGEDSEPAQLRLVNPAEQEAEITVSVLGAEGSEVLPGAEDQILEPGTVTDVSLDGLPAGPATVQVSSDVPVTGSVLMNQVGEAGELDPDQPVRDRAWLGAQEPVDHGLLTLPALGEEIDEAQVALSNPLPQDQSVQVQSVTAEGEAGDPVTIEVPATSSVQLEDQVDLADAVALEISGEAVLASAMLMSQAADGQLLTVMPLTPDADIEQRVPVRLGTG